MTCINNGTKTSRKISHQGTQNQNDAWVKNVKPGLNPQFWCIRGYQSFETKFSLFCGVSPPINSRVDFPQGLTWKQSPPGKRSCQLCLPAVASRLIIIDLGSYHVLSTFLGCLLIWLVVSTILKNMSSSMGNILSQYMKWKIIQPCSSHHQPA